MTLPNATLNYYSNGEIADETVFNRPLVQLLANDSTIDGRIDNLYPGLPIAIAGGTADAITATFAPAITLSNMTIVAVVASAANATTTPTFAPNGLTAHTIVKHGGQALLAGDIPNALAVILLQYNLANTRWELLNPAPLSPISEPILQWF